MNYLNLGYQANIKELDMTIDSYEQIHQRYVMSKGNLGDYIMNTLKLYGWEYIDDREQEEDWEMSFFKKSFSYNMKIEITIGVVCKNEGFGYGFETIQKIKTNDPDNIYGVGVDFMKESIEYVYEHLICKGIPLKNWERKKEFKKWSENWFFSQRMRNIDKMLNVNLHNVFDDYDRNLKEIIEELKGKELKGEEYIRERNRRFIEKACEEYVCYLEEKNDKDIDGAIYAALHNESGNIDREYDAKLLKKPFEILTETYYELRNQHRNYMNELVKRIATKEEN